MCATRICKQKRTFHSSPPHRPNFQLFYLPKASPHGQFCPHNTHKKHICKCMLCINWFGKQNPSPPPQGGR